MFFFLSRPARNEFPDCSRLFPFTTRASLELNICSRRNIKGTGHASMNPNKQFLTAVLQSLSLLPCSHSPLLLRLRPPLWHRLPPTKSATHLSAPPSSPTLTTWPSLTPPTDASSTSNHMLCHSDAHITFFAATLARRPRRASTLPTPPPPRSSCAPTIPLGCLLPVPAVIRFAFKARNSMVPTSRSWIFGICPRAAARGLRTGECMHDSICAPYIHLRL
jgi:hypothetical protein